MSRRRVQAPLGDAALSARQRNTRDTILQRIEAGTVDETGWLQRAEQAVLRKRKRFNWKQLYRFVDV